jgi:hypothetical protein
VLCRDGLAGHLTSVPVLLKAVSIAESPMKLAEQILSATESVGNGSAAFTVADMEAGKVCLLIDAIDEIGTEKMFEMFCGKLAEFDEAYSACKLIASSRNYSYIVKLIACELHAIQCLPIGLARRQELSKPR